MRNSSYRGQVSKILNFDPMSDMVSVEDDQRELIFGPALNGESLDSDVPPFYISLRVHEFVLHNAMFDSGVPPTILCRRLSWRSWVWTSLGNTMIFIHFILAG